MLPSIHTDSNARGFRTQCFATSSTQPNVLTATSLYHPTDSSCLGPAHCLKQTPHSLQPATPLTQGPQQQSFVTPLLQYPRKQQQLYAQPTASNSGLTASTQQHPNTQAKPPGSNQTKDPKQLLRPSPLPQARAAQPPASNTQTPNQNPRQQSD
jgi:hypothetical protein